MQTVTKKPTGFSHTCRCCGEGACAPECLGCQVLSNADCPNCAARREAERDRRWWLHLDLEGAEDE